MRQELHALALTRCGQSRQQSRRADLIFIGCPPSGAVWMRLNPRIGLRPFCQSRLPTKQLRQFDALAFHGEVVPVRHHAGQGGRLSNRFGQVIAAAPNQSGVDAGLIQKLFAPQRPQRVTESAKAIDRVGRSIKVGGR